MAVPIGLVAIGIPLIMGFVSDIIPKPGLTREENEKRLRQLVAMGLVSALTLVAVLRTQS
jgi:hypothetical protein